MTDSLATASVLSSVSDELANTVERAGAAVVTIDARRRHTASGIVWSNDGLVVTANHVVERDEEIEAALPDGRRVAATLVGRDPASDLALLRLAEGGLTPLAHGAEPPVGRVSPSRILSRVDLPAPLGPRSPMAPWGTERSMLSSATTLP